MDLRRGPPGLEAGSGLLEGGFHDASFLSVVCRAQSPVGLSPGPVEISPGEKGHGQPCKIQVSPPKVVRPPSQP